MSEPTAAPPAELPVDQLTPEEAGAEVRQIRGNREHPFHREGHREHDAALDRVTQLSERAHAAEPAAELSASPPDETRAPLDAFDDQSAPQTAAALAAMPPPAFSPEAEKAGWRWDAEKLPGLYATAEEEGLVPLVRDGLHVVARLAAEPRGGVEAEHDAVIQGWGSRASAKLDAVDRFEALVRKRHPEVLAELERTGKTEHRLWLEYAARGGELMMDPTTPGGERRLRAKYTKGAGPRDAA